MTNDLKYSLTELADAASPPSTIDIDRARHDGRRRLLTARLAPVGAGLAVVAACGIAVSGIAGGSSPTSDAAGHPAGPARQSPQSPQSPQTTNTTGTATAQTAKTLTGTDPLHAHAAFGRLPAGWVHGSVEDGPDYGNHIEAYSGPDKASGPYANLGVTATEPRADEYPGETTDPATVAGSQKAYYIYAPPMTADGPPVHGLRWKTASGLWVSLFASHVGSKAETRSLLDTLAAGVVVGDSEVPLPLHIDGLPKSLSARSQELNVPGLSLQKNAAFSVQLVFSSGSDQIIITAEPTAPARPAATQQTPPPGTATLPPRAQTAKPDRACKDDNSVTVCVDAAPGVLSSVGGAQGVLDHITSLGTDQANWTTHVVG